MTEKQKISTKKFEASVSTPSAVNHRTLREEPLESYSTSLFDLPDDLLLEIFVNFTSLRDIEAVASTHRRLRALAEESISFSTLKISTMMRSHMGSSIAFCGSFLISVA